MGDPVIDGILDEVGGCVDEVVAHRAGAIQPEQDAEMPWSNFRVVYDNTIGNPEVGTIRLELDRIGQARVSIQQDGKMTVIGLADEQLRDLEHMILRGLNHLALHERKGWAA